jgi:hypothetical protein
LRCSAPNGRGGRCPVACTPHDKDEAQRRRHARRDAEKMANRLLNL